MTVLVRVLDATLAYLFEPPCAACGRANPSPLSGAVCAACWARIGPQAPAVVVVPGRSISCWAAVGEYDGVLREIIHALKYDGRRSIARPLGRLMRVAGAGVLDGADLVVPVPLHRRRRWSRGFNQAALLAAELGLPVGAPLRRARHTRPQVELPADARHRNVVGAFAPTGAVATVRGRRVVLVDDVTTTGATLEACARLLRDAGAAELRALTAARVATGRPAAHRP